jgi:multidrug efflux pump subunit AcrA (membrane-fusion protein)
MPNWRQCCPPPDFKSGDRAWPGQVIAEVPDLSTLRVTARLEEAERGRMQPGQRVVVRADAVPDKELAGKIEDISALARVDFSSWPPQRNFNLIVAARRDGSAAAAGHEHHRPRGRRSRGRRRADSRSVRVFEKEGRSVAYVRTRTGWTSGWYRLRGGARNNTSCARAWSPASVWRSRIHSRDKTMTEANRKRIGWSLAGVLGVALLVAAIAVAPMQGVQSDGDVIPTARVAEGDVPVVVHASGELKPMRAQTLVAPSVGGPMQILSIEATGTPVKEAIRGRVRQERAGRTSRNGKVRAGSGRAGNRQDAADAVVQRAQDEVTLLTARFDVRRAELDVQGSLLSSAIDKQKFVLTLEETKARLAQLQNDLQSRADTDRASLAVLEEKRNKARLQMDNAQKNIDNMTLRAPFDGLVAAKDNDMNNAAWAGVVVPEFRAGDTVYRAVRSPRCCTSRASSSSPRSANTIARTSTPVKTRK